MTEGPAGSAASSRLQQLRAERQLTQQELSELSGIDRDKIAKIETGVRRMSGTDVLYIAEALGVTPRQLLGAMPDRGRFRGTIDRDSADVQTVSDWFDEYIDDVLFLDRTAKRHGLV
jgi:transcriptional regulator with XRE-family HTH domain